MKKLLLAVAILLSACSNPAAYEEKPTGINCDTEKEEHLEKYGYRESYNKFSVGGSWFTYWHYPAQGFDVSFEENESYWGCVVEYSYYSPY